MRIRLKESWAPMLETFPFHKALPDRTMPASLAPTQTSLLTLSRGAGDFYFPAGPCWHLRRNCGSLTPTDLLLDGGNWNSAAWWELLAPEERRGRSRVQIIPICPLPHYALLVPSVRTSPFLNIAMSTCCFPRHWDIEKDEGGTLILSYLLQLRLS